MFSESRVYAAWDPYHRIDRRTSAKKQELYLKQFEEERMLRVLFVVSGGASMQFATQHPSKITVLETLGTIITTLWLEQWDQVGYALITHWVTTFKKPSKRKWMINARQWALQNTAFQWTQSLQEAALLLQKYRLHNHLIVWVSDQCMNESDHALHALAKENDLLYIHLFDPFEVNPDPNTLDAAFVEITSNATQKIIWKNDLDTYNHAFSLMMEQSLQQAAKRGITATCANSIDDPVRILAELFKKHSLKK